MFIFFSRRRDFGGYVISYSPDPECVDMYVGWLGQPDAQHAAHPFKAMSIPHWGKKRSCYVG